MQFNNPTSTKKQEKEIMLSKNRNIQFTTARLLIPVFLACLAAVFTTATTPVSARDQVPFNGIVSGTIISSVPLNECHVLIEAVNGGNATQLGRFQRNGGIRPKCLRPDLCRQLRIYRSQRRQYFGPVHRNLDPDTNPRRIRQQRTRLHNRWHGSFCQRDWHVQPGRTNR